ncbi:MAG: N-acetylglucosamine-6-phosphate deacetylase [Planctomycetota bacterium]
MKPLRIVGANLILPDRIATDWAIRIEDGKIFSISKEEENCSDIPTIDAGGKYLSPGFIDLHVHGAAGADFMDGTEDAVRTACAEHLKHGTTTIFPTTATGRQDQILAMLEACQVVAREKEGPSIPGIHLYGPFFAADKVGCHSLEGRRSPTWEEFESYFESGFVKIATCAAELPGAREFYQAAAKAGCLITCGHSNSSWPEMQAAFDAGMRHVDHYWCAMSSVPSLRQRFGTPMQASMTEFVLMNEAMSTEVIADGFHLSPELLEFAYKMIGPSRLCLVTDCNRAMGMPSGEYRFGNVQDGSWFKSDGHVGWAPDGGSLASSIVGMDHMVQTMKRLTSASIPEVIRMASLTPAERVGIADRKGSLEVGKDADLLVLSSDLEVEQVIVGGRRLPKHGA